MEADIMYAKFQTIVSLRKSTRKGKLAAYTCQTIYDIDAKQDIHDQAMLT